MRAVEKCRTYILVDSAYLPHLKVDTEGELIKFDEISAMALVAGSSVTNWKVDLLIFMMKWAKFCSDCCSK